MAPLGLDLVNSGTLLDVSGAKPLTLDEARSAWHVRRGKLDVFLVNNRNGELAGPRRHVLRAEESEAVFGCSPLARQDVRLIAVASPGTALERLELAPLNSGENVNPARSVAMIEGWISKLSAAAAGDVPPKLYTVVEPGKKVKLQRGRSAVSVRHVVWVKHIEGSSCFLKEEHAALSSDGLYFPITSQTWLTAAVDTTIECFDLPFVLTNDREWRSLDQFHTLVLNALQAKDDELERRSNLRLGEKHASAARQMRAALRRLAGPFVSEQVRTAVLLERDEDPLIAACQIAGASAGIEIVSPPRDPDGKPLSDPLRLIGRSSNVRMRRVLLRANWWTDDHRALVGYRIENKRPVALVYHGKHGYYLHDPVEGSTTKVNSTVAGTLEPFAESFYRPFPNKPLTAKDLVSFGLRDCRGELTSVLLAGIASGLIGLTVPIVTGNLFDTVIPGAQRNVLTEFTWLLIAAAIATGMFELTRNFALQRLDGKVGSTLQAAVWDRLLTLPVSFFRQYSAGDLSDRANGIDSMRSALTGTVTQSIVSGIFSVFNLALMFYYSWKLAIVAMCLVIVALVGTFSFGSAQTRRARPLAKTSGWLSGQVLEFVSGIAKLRAAGTEGNAFATWTKTYSRLKQLNTGSRSVANSYSVFNAFLFIFGPMTIFFTVDQWTGRISTGDFIAFNAAFGQMFSATMSLGSATLQVMSMRPYFERAAPILQAAPEVSTIRADPGDLTGDIEISGVSFRYRSDTPLVLTDISLRIEPGQFVAFVGPSGCGKSTLFRMLLGFEEPEVGSVFYDGRDLKGLDVNGLRRRMGVVLQNGMLFRGDLFSNIVGSKPLTLDDAWQALKLCGLYDEVRQMPMGLQTVVSEGGGGLSGGQRQRLMIARAIVNRPRIVLLDEATSALDNENQSIVSASLESLKATRIVIAHRLSTIINADKIFVFDQGRLVQSGTYQELIGVEGTFAELAKRQIV